MIGQPQRRFLPGSRQLCLFGRSWSRRGGAFAITAGHRKEPLRGRRGAMPYTSAPGLLIVQSQVRESSRSDWRIRVGNRCDVLLLSRRFAAIATARSLASRPSSDGQHQGAASGDGNKLPPLAPISHGQLGSRCAPRLRSRIGHPRIRKSAA